MNIVDTQMLINWTEKFLSNMQVYLEEKWRQVI